jgi:hypothetical protein
VQTLMGSYDALSTSTRLIVPLPRCSGRAPGSVATGPGCSPASSRVNGAVDDWLDT